MWVRRLAKWKRGLVALLVLGFSSLGAGTTDKDSTQTAYNPAKLSEKPFPQKIEAFIADADLNWNSELTKESEVPSTTFYLIIKNYSPEFIFSKFSTTDMQQEWSPKYYRLHPNFPLEKKMEIPIEEGETIVVPPRKDRYVKVKVTEPNLPRKHLFADFDFYYRTLPSQEWIKCDEPNEPLPEPVPAGKWEKYDKVEANLCVPGNLMFIEGKEDILSEWIDEDRVAKTTDIEEIVAGGSYEYEMNRKETKTFTIRISNLENATSDFLLKEAKKDFPGITRYYDDNFSGKEITESVKHGGYFVPDIGPRENCDIRMCVTAVGIRKDYQKITLMAKIRNIRDPITFYGPYNRFDAFNLAFKILPRWKLRTSNWREIHK